MSYSQYTSSSRKVNVDCPVWSHIPTNESPFLYSDLFESIGTELKYREERCAGFDVVPGIYCADDYNSMDKDVMNRTRPLNEAILMRNIQINTPNVRRAIVIDIDADDAFDRWSDRNAPAPSIMLVNKTNGHAHYIYMLNTPVTFWANSKEQPQKFYEAMTRTMTRGLGGDPNYVQTGLVKNPMCTDWEVYSSGCTYSLGYLREYTSHFRGQKSQTEIESKYESVEISEVSIDECSQNPYVFQSARNHGIKAIRSGIVEEEQLFAEVYRAAIEADKNFEVSLGQQHLFKMAGRVVSFLLKHIDTIKVGTGLNRAENARKVAENRRNSTEEKVIAAVNALRERGDTINSVSIGKETGLSRSTVLRYRSLYQVPEEVFTGKSTTCDTVVEVTDEIVSDNATEMEEISVENTTAYKQEDVSCEEVSVQEVTETNEDELHINMNAADMPDFVRSWFMLSGNLLTGVSGRRYAKVLKILAILTISVFMAVFLTTRQVLKVATEGVMQVVDGTTGIVLSLSRSPICGDLLVAILIAAFVIGSG